MSIVVITGTSRGIGMQTAKRFLQNGWEVIGSTTSGKSMMDHQHYSLYRLDLRYPDTIEEFTHSLPEFDILINNAGILLEDFEDESVNIDKLKRTFEVNVFSLIQLTELCIPKIRPKGQILNLSSGWGTFSGNDSAKTPAYKLSKACVNMYTRLLSIRLKNLTVSSFDPGWVKTDMGSPLAPKNAFDAAEEIYELLMREKKSGCFWKNKQVRDW